MQSTADRIAAEHTAIAKAEQAIAVHAEQLKTALFNGDDPQTNLCQQEISSARQTIALARERVELLEQKLGQESEQAANAELDRIAESANAARGRGEKIILQAYPKLAKQISALLHELTEVENSIASANATLDAAGRDTVSPANQVRYYLSDLGGELAQPLTDTVALPNSEANNSPDHWKQRTAHDVYAAAMEALPPLRAQLRAA